MLTSSFNKYRVADFQFSVCLLFPSVQHMETYPRSRQLHHTQLAADPRSRGMRAAHRGDDYDVADEPSGEESSSVTPSDNMEGEEDFDEQELQAFAALRSAKQRIDEVRRNRGAPHRSDSATQPQATEHERQRIGGFEEKTA